MYQERKAEVLYQMIVINPIYIPIPKNVTVIEMIRHMKLPRHLLLHLVVIIHVHMADEEIWHVRRKSRHEMIKKGRRRGIWQENLMKLLVGY